MHYNDFPKWFNVQLVPETCAFALEKSYALLGVQYIVILRPDLDS